MVRHRRYGSSTSSYGNTASLKGRLLEDHLDQLGNYKLASTPVIVNGSFNYLGTEEHFLNHM